MYEESNEMKELRKIRDQHYQETRILDRKQLIDFYKNKAKEVQDIAKSKHVS